MGAIGELGGAATGGILTRAVEADLDGLLFAFTMANLAGRVLAYACGSEAQAVALMDNLIDALVRERAQAAALQLELGFVPGFCLLPGLGHLVDRDPHGRALGRIIQHRRCTARALGGEPGDLFVHRGQGLYFPSCGLCFPGGEPLRRRGLFRTGLPGDGAARLGLGAAGVLPGLLVQQPQRA
ncbi:MAG: hypothetical protein ACRDPF_29015, partial [Streptosporangiaceae bacterium]